MLDFLRINFMDIIDILLVGSVIFYILRALRGSQAMSIFVVIVGLYAVRVVCESFGMELMSSLLGAVLDVGLLALIIIFQPELRRFLTNLSNTHHVAARRHPVLAKLLGLKINVDSAGTLNEICEACEAMSREKCGALIVLRKDKDLGYIIETGDALDARVSERLLRNLFFKNSPLHDGAVIIDGDRVVSARCTLPLTNRELPPSYGMRHRAAVGMSEESDATVIVVSEETGTISVARHGEVQHAESDADLKRLIKDG